MPWASGDQELFQQAVGSVPRDLSTSAGCAGTYVVFYEGADTWPGIFPAD